MKVDRLLDYLQGRTAGAPDNENKKTANSNERAAQGATANSEAVSLAPNFGQSAAARLVPDPQAQRAERVAEIKSQIQAGSYKQPDSTTLANVLVRDLL